MKKKKFSLNNMENWPEIDEKSLTHTTWKIAQTAWNMPSQDKKKFTLVSYWISALWGCCLALNSLLQLIIQSRALGTADHVLSLDDLFLFRVWRLDAPAHPSATILWPRVTCSFTSCLLSWNGKSKASYNSIWTQLSLICISTPMKFICQQSRQKLIRLHYW